MQQAGLRAQKGRPKTSRGGRPELQHSAEPKSLTEHALLCPGL